MENMSKALIFAASVLISVMLLSLMVFLFRRFGASASNTELLLTRGREGCFQ